MDYEKRVAVQKEKENENKRKEEALKNTNRKNNKHTSNFFGSDAGLKNKLDFVELCLVSIFLFLI